MNAKEQLAARLKERKGIEARTERSEPPGPVTPPRAPGKNGRRRPRYSPSQLRLVRLETQLRAANRRAEKAESSLGELQAKIKVAWAKNRAKNRRITYLEAVANARSREAKAAVERASRVQAGNEKVWRLQQEITRLQCAAKERLRPQRVAATGYMTKIRKLWGRIDALEAENEQLRTSAKGASA